MIFLYFYYSVVLSHQNHLHKQNSQQSMNQQSNNQGSSNNAPQNNGENPPPNNRGPQQNDGNTHKIMVKTSLLEVKISRSQIKKIFKLRRREKET